MEQNRHHWSSPFIQPIGSWLRSLAEIPRSFDPKLTDPEAWVIYPYYLGSEEA